MLYVTREYRVTSCNKHLLYFHVTQITILLFKLTQSLSIPNISQAHKIDKIQKFCSLRGYVFFRHFVLKMYLQSCIELPQYNVTSLISLEIFLFQVKIKSWIMSLYFTEGKSNLKSSVPLYVYSFFRIIIERLVKQLFSQDVYIIFLQHDENVHKLRRPNVEKYIEF